MAIKINKQRFIAMSISALFILWTGFINASVLSAASQVQTSGAGLVSKVAPGDFLPLSVKLLNLGNSNKVDVTITYKITDAKGKIIYSAQETVAVETTASFVKTIQIPFDTTPGQYTAQSSIIYQDQVTPATSQFPFTVERKILGIFLSDFYLYLGILIVASIVAGILSRAWIRRLRPTRLVTMDYSDIPHETRVFYELISDTVMEIRQQVGEKAMDIAKQIDGLNIDEKTGRVLKLTKKPSKVIAELVSGYEKILGKKVSFSFRRS